MRPQSRFWTVNLLAVLAIASCAPDATTAPAGSTVAAVFTSTQLANTSAPAATVPASPQSVEPLAVATSRGPDLEATDPTTVNLASGQLQLVEFFRFT